MSLPSHVGDGIAEVTLATARCRCRGNIGHGMMSLSSLAGDGAIKALLVVA
jgi:hypothetical protein